MKDLEKMEKCMITHRMQAVVIYIIINCIAIVLKMPKLDSNEAMYFILITIICICSFVISKQFQICVKYNISPEKNGVFSLAYKILGFMYLFIAVIEMINL